jgi:hypothetical protein
MTFENGAALASAVVLAGMYLQGRRVNRRLRARLRAHQQEVRRGR